MKNRLLIAVFVSVCFLSGSCKISSGQGNQYDFFLWILLSKDG